MKSKRSSAHARVFLGTLLVLTLLGLSSTAYAQSQAGTGQIVGTIYDESGAVLPGATVTVTNQDTGLTREVESSEAGLYRFVLLPPGRYALVVQRSGFKSTQSEFTVNVGATVTLNATLPVGDVTEVIEVVATPVINTTQSETDALLNVKSIENLPINGRRFQDFVVLTPTVQIEPQRNQISFAGQRGINGNITIDGADYNQPFFGGIRGGERSNEAFSIPQESIAEFQAVASGFSAEFGRSTGGLLNAVTKSGTNAWHGSAFYFLRHKDLGKKDAKDRDAITTLNQYGGSIGGPISPNKSFFFGAIEAQNNDNPRVVVYNRLAGVTPTAEQQEAFDFYRSLETPFTQTNEAYTFLVKLDHNFNPNHSISARYNWSKNDAENAVATGTQISPETDRALTTNGTEGDRTNTVMGRWTGIFSPTVINELRITFTREDRPRIPNSEQPIVHTSIGRFGTRSFLPTDEYDYRLQFANNLTWNTGGHSVKFGGEFNRLVADQIFGFNQFGRFFFFSGTGTILDGLSAPVGGVGINRFDDTVVDYLLQIGNLKARMEMEEIAFYVTDAWRINPNFTLTLGLRWEGYFNPEPEANNTSLINLVGGTTFPLGRVNPATIGDNADQWMPRVGIAWDPGGDGKTVIRAGGGLYYARNPLLLMADPMNNFRSPPGNVSVSLPLTNAIGCDTVYCQFSLIGIDLNTITLDAIPMLSPADITAIATALGITADPFIGASVTAWQDGYDSPRSLNWTAGVERELAPGLKVGADFMYLNTVHLQRNHNLNMAPPDPALTLADGRPRFDFSNRPITSLTDVSIRESSARAVYRAGTFRVEYRHSRYQLQAFYTLSKNESSDDNERSAGGFDYENGFDLTSEFGPSRLDTRHVVRFNAVTELPGGVTLSGSTFLRSGRPLDARVGFDANGDRDGADRPYQAVGVPFTRNAFRDQPFYEVNFRAAKGFNLGEERRILITFDFFNLFNNDNITIGSNNARYGLGIDTTTGATLAPECSSSRCFLRTHLSDGTIDPNNGVGRPFQMQIGLRFTF